jgi:pimeloyl-ACP methyl ester carboxylesterase
MSSGRPWIAVVAGLVLATGCSVFGGAGPAASTLPHISVTRPVVIVPGLLGSRLEDERNGRVVWGKIFSLRALTVHETLIQPDYDGKDGLELPIDSTDFRANRDHLVATEIMDRFTVIPHMAEVKAYARMLEAFEVCGYRPGGIQSCGLDVNAAVFAYDWRRDIVENAQLLAAKIRDIQANTGDPTIRVDIVAHSMGGLIAEYYALYGGEDVLASDPLPAPTYAGAANLRKLILLGVPHLGSAEAVEILHRGHHVGWRSISNEAIFTMPSIYQLLPPVDAAHISTGGADGFDLYAAGDWERFDVSVFSPESRRAFLRRCKVFFPADWQRQSDELYSGFRRFLDVSLRRAERLHRALAHFAERPPGHEVVMIGSATRETPAALELVEDRGSWRLRSVEDGGLQPGDGTVTAASFTWRRGDTQDGSLPSTAGAGFPVEWVDAKHSRLPSDSVVLRRLAEILAE